MIRLAPVTLVSVFSSGAFGYMFDYFLWCVLFVSLMVHTYCFFRLFPRKRFPRTGLLMGNALVFLCMLGAVGFAAESYLRFVAVYTDSFGVSLPARRWFALHTKLNSLGCRDPEWSTEKPPGTRRIAFVGDSYTYGWGIERVEDRFPDQIQARFRDRTSQSVEVMNVAKPGWGTGDELRPIADMIKHYDVDEIVLCYVPNDVEKLISTDTDFDPTRPPDYQFINLDSSPLLDYLYRRTYLPLVPSVRKYHDWLADGLANDAIWAQHVAQVAQMVEACHSRGVTLRVAILPFLVTSGDQYDAASVHDRVASLLAGWDVPVVDLLAELKERQIEPRSVVVNSLDGHPNEQAHAVFADALWNAWYARAGGITDNK